MYDFVRQKQVLGLPQSASDEAAAKTRVAERWFVTDDTQYTSWADADGVAVPLFWLLRHDPQAALGEAHAAAYGEALGMVGKYLNAAEPLSGQMHIGITEGYLVIEMDPGTGLFLGLNDPMTDETTA